MDCSFVEEFYKICNKQGTYDIDRPIIMVSRGVNKDSVGGGGKIFEFGVRISFVHSFYILQRTVKKTEFISNKIKNNSFTLSGKIFKSLEKLLCKTLKKY